jgi:VRR-NUC domain
MGRRAGAVGEGRASPALRETEAGFQRFVVEAAELYGWREYHTFDSRRSQPGFPDLVLVRRPRVIFAEVKTDKGLLSGAQADWLDDLDQCQRVETYIWRPALRGLIVDVLR